MEERRHWAVEVGLALRKDMKFETDTVPVEVEQEPGNEACFGGN